MPSPWPRLADLVVRPIRPDEVDAWCACPRRPDDQDLASFVEGERAWIAQCHPTLEWLFVAQWAGAIVGKYDVPIREARGWVCWAPQVRVGPARKRILAALADDLMARARVARARRIEVLLDPGHPSPQAAAEALAAAGFAFLERRVLVERRLDATLPPCPRHLTLADPHVLPDGVLRRLRRAVGGDDADAEEAVRLVREGHDGVVLLEDGQAIGLALAVTPPGEDPLGEEHVGLVPAARGRGLGPGLLLALLHRGRDHGATVYLGSTAETNVPMRRTFARVGAREFGVRSAWRGEPGPLAAAGGGTAPAPRP